MRLERKCPLLTLAGADDKPLADEIELDLEDFIADRDRRRAKPTRAHIERDLPAVVEPRRQCEPDFADDLRPKLRSCSCVAKQDTTDWAKR
jgi:hypothetical protein